MLAKLLAALLPQTAMTNGHADPEVRATVLEATQHVRTSRRLQREIKAVQVQLERTSVHQGVPGWRSTQSHP